MKNRLTVIACVILAASLVSSNADARGTSQPRYATHAFMQSPYVPSAPQQTGGSMFQAAAATTTLLGWWQFDGPNQMPDEQGWTEHDITAQIKTCFHVAGSAGGCDAITPISGTKSMWCGQWSTGLEPWCSWTSLPGYGNDWSQCLETASASNVTYTIRWESEAGYDYTYVEWWDASYGGWVADPVVNGGQGSYDGAGGPQTETSTSTYGATKFRFRFASDDAYSDEDGLWPTAQGSVMLDDLIINGGPTEDWEDEACNAQQSSDGKWFASSAAGFGLYSALHRGTDLVQQDPCFYQQSWLWGFFDDPAVTAYWCGGWPNQGAMPFGPDENGLYLDNEIWSPWIPLAGPGGEVLLSFLTYRDLPLDNLQFYRWHVRTRDNDAGGCPSVWKDQNQVYYGGQKDWFRASFDVGAFVGQTDDEIQIALGAVDMCGVWCGVSGNSPCHSHAPLFDQVRLTRVGVYGPRWIVRDIDLWQDNFPEEGGVGPTDYARCDMAQSILPSLKKNILPGDSLKVVVTDPVGLADDNTGGRLGKAVYVFVKVTDRWGNPVAGKNGLAIQSPDNRAYAGDPSDGLLRWPFVPGVAPAGWDAYRMDRVYAYDGSIVKDTYCADLMDLGSGPTGPHYKHANESVAANTGVFTPGDVITYFFAATNTNNEWSYWHRSFFRYPPVSQIGGQGVGRRTNNVSEAILGACEWSVLPDAGRNPDPAYRGDILFVDDADDRIVVDDRRTFGAPAQIYMDWALEWHGITSWTDRFDVLGPSSCVGNSLASRVKNVTNQLIGTTVGIYRQVLWNSSDLSRGLMGDGGVLNGGSSAERSDDFALCYTFLNTHPNNPGWAYWGDEVVQDWATLTGAGAANVKNVYMNHTLANNDQRTVSGIVSPRVLPASPAPPAGYLQPAESFYAYGGCPVINDFDSPGQAGNSRVSHRYANATTGPVAALSQKTPNAAGTTARFFLAGFGFDFIRDDDLCCGPEQMHLLREILQWFGNSVPQAVGIEPVAYANSLENAYPNPFNPTTTIRYSIASAGHVTLRIYNAAGQLVRTLVDEEQQPASEGYSARWDGLSGTGAPAASGVYFYKLTAKGFSETKKTVLLK